MGKRDSAERRTTVIGGLPYPEHVEAMKRRVRTAQDSVQLVIETEEQFRDDPDRRDRAEDRIIQAEREQAILDAELSALEAGDLKAVTGLHEDYMRQEAASERRMAKRPAR